MSLSIIQIQIHFQYSFCSRIVYNSSRVILPQEREVLTHAAYSQLMTGCVNPMNMQYQK